MIEEKLINFETAKLAKEKGFNLNELTRVGFSPDGLELSEDFWGYYCNEKRSVARPTQTLLQRWLREEHNIMVSVITAYSGGFIGEELVKSFKPSIEIINVIGKNIFTNDLKYEMFHGLEPMSYDEALELGLLEGLKLITKIK